MQLPQISFLMGDLSDFDQQVLALEDQRAYPTEDALTQLGTVLMNELLDTTMGSGLEDHQTIIAEALIGGLHSAIQRLEREADRSRDQVQSRMRDFDGTEIADVELQEATRKTNALDVAVKAVEFVRDAASSSYTTATGEVWTPWRGNVRPSRLTAAQLQAKSVIRAAELAKQQPIPAGSVIIAFRGSPKANTAIDANRIFDALNWALKEHPNMVLATTGANGAEKLAARWAKQKNVTLITAAADFDRFHKAAPFKANDEVIRLEPTLCLTIPNSLDPEADTTPFGPALNLGQKAVQNGIRHIPIRA